MRALFASCSGPLYQVKRLSGGATTNIGPLPTGGDDGNACRRWTFTSHDNNIYNIYNVNTGTTLDAEDCGTADGTAVRQRQELDNKCQQWNIVP